MPEEQKHYRYGGSKAGRLIQCPANLQRTDTLPKTKQSSPYAARGTLLHEVQEYLRNTNMLPKHYDWSTDQPDLTETEAAEYAEVTEQTYQWVENILDEHDLYDLIVEPLVTVNDETGGSIDLVAYNEDTCVLLDYKYGRGIVSAKNNPQGLFYLWCLYRDLNYQDIVRNKKLFFVIIQPAQGKPDIWEVTSEELEAFEKKYLNAVEISKQDNPPACAGYECTFCAYKPICPEHISYARRAITLDPHDKETLQEALQLANKLENWSKSVFTFAQEMLEHGEQVTDYKLVQKRAVRKFKDPKLVEEALKGSRNKEQYFKHTLLTPPQIEKLKNVPKRLTKLFLEQTVKRSSGVTIAPKSDKREAVSYETPEILKEMVKKA